MGSNCQFRSLSFTALLAAFASWPSSACEINTVPPVQRVDADGGGLHDLPHPGQSPHTAIHGQLMFGVERVYVSHLAVPMQAPGFHPHSFQILLEVGFADPSAATTYKTEVTASPGTIFTAVPPPFDQTAIVASYPGREPLRNFEETTVFRGHFEQGGTPIVQDDLEIRRVLHFREFQRGAQPIENLVYVLFGDGENAHLAHYIDGTAPNFDSILDIEIGAPDALTHSDRALYVHLPDRPNTEAERLRSGESLRCRMTEAGGSGRDIDLRITREIYCEAGEFSALVTDNFNTPRACVN